MGKFDNDSLYDRNKFLVAKTEHVKNTLNAEELTKLSEIMYKIYMKYPNEYLVVNQDEPYSNKVWDLIKENEKKIIVGFIGSAGSGKDHQSHLLEEKGYKQLAFADALRDIACASLGLNLDVCKSLYDSLKKSDCIQIDLARFDDLFQSYSITFRQFLEKLGTEGIRKYDNDFWCKALLKTIKDNNYKKVCISDMRFLNEYNHVKNFAKENNYEFKVIFCDYHSERYDYNNSHASAKLANYFVNKGYKDLQELTDDDFKKFEEEVGE